jgi:hypothetical protein
VAELHGCGQRRSERSGGIVSVNVTYNYKFMLLFMPKVSIPFSTTSQLAISQ